jgi:nucleoside-diphosphate-sugar epimerase
VRLLVTGTKGNLGCRSASTLFADSHDVVRYVSLFWKGELQ